MPYNAPLGLAVVSKADRKLDVKNSQCAKSARDLPLCSFCEAKQFGEIGCSFS